MSQAPQEGGAHSEPPIDQDDIDTVKPEQHPTSTPPASQFIHIVIFCEHEHMRPFASTMKLFIESHAFGDRMSSVKLADPLHEIDDEPLLQVGDKPRTDFIIMMIDEFTELGDLMKLVWFHYPKTAKVVAVTEHANLRLHAQLRDNNVQELESSLDLRKLCARIERLARAAVL